MRGYGHVTPRKRGWCIGTNATGAFIQLPRVFPSFVVAPVCVGTASEYNHVVWIVVSAICG